MATALIQERGTVSGNQPRMRRINEKAGQTFKAGTPLQMYATNGSLQAWDGTTVSDGIAGISKEFGANLSTAGVAQQQTFGSVQNESAAVNMSRPYFNDGKTGIVLANQDTVFYGQVGPSQSLTGVVIGDQYGLTIDSDGHWYVDTSKTGVSAVLEIVGFDDWDTTRGVRFVFLATATQVLA